MYIVNTVKKDGYMERYTQTIGKNVYTVRGKFGYLVVRKKNSLSVFLLYPCLEGKCGIISKDMVYCLHYLK